ncbi:MAG: DUF1971 domain-containing protein [Rickettsiales bacterium]|jgi:tellurite methyltransferase
MNARAGPDYPTDLPPGLTFRRKTPVFTEASVPDALTKDHTTKAGVWGVIHVKRGRLRYCVPSEGSAVEIAAGGAAIVAPEVPHRVTPLGEVAFYVAFWGASDS